ncbi:hypothetical protein H4R18_004344 [Coemansia javaensis]|uniref:Prenylcysteine lyase domain-containing protein n=1 Tax=Coemansia javaensis TaxID=2761396 RepID=A0A9W8H9Q5_9FUNG|nr:hypothetical protein H4R18_004344 [Coemansia javaensis]
MRRIGWFLAWTGAICGALAAAPGGGARRIAVVGAGPAGAAAAYFAQEELRARGEQPAEIHVFERSGRVGGRVRAGTVVHGNRTLHFEMGASMFIGKNRHLVELAGRFNLTLCTHPCTYAGGTRGLDATLRSYGIWDPEGAGAGAGGQWVVGPGSGWRVLDVIRALWRYRGIGDLGHVRKRTAAAVGEFMQSYHAFANQSGGVFSTWDEYLADKPVLRSSLYYTAAEYYLSAGEAVRPRLLKEVVSLATRVNYMQDVDAISTLGAHISMAAESDTGYSVAGGNWQVFDRALAASGARLHLHTKVTNITHAGEQYTVHARAAGRTADELNFDTVIIAAPLPLAGIDVLDNKHRALIAAEYVHMYVTFAIGTLRSTLLPRGPIPQLVITPYRTTRPFNCMSILACLGPDGAGAGKGCRDGPVLVKIFSHQPVDLGQVFESTTWHHEQQWDAYPKLVPRNAGYAVQDPDSKAFTLRRPSPPPIVLDAAGGGGGGGVFYVNGMESLFSTMESQTVAARHVVRLALFGRSGVALR